jgi:hypothetical protein
LIETFIPQNSFARAFSQLISDGIGGVCLSTFQTAHFNLAHCFEDETTVEIKTFCY